MSKLTKMTTGQIAKAAQVSVRTVQYYDQRGLLQPSELTEGGRRLYSQADLDKLLVITYLRQLAFSIGQIKEVLAEETINSTVTSLIDLHLADLRGEIDNKTKQVDRLVNLKKQLKSNQVNTVNQLSDISLTMKTQHQWRKCQIKLITCLLTSSLLLILCASLAKYAQIPWLMWLVLPLFLLFIYRLTRAYHQQVVYLCPTCHHVFQPSFRSFVLGAHTPRTRRLTCPDCQTQQFCIELVNTDSSK